MGRPSRWIGIVGAAFGLLTLGLTAQAWACNNPAIGSSAEATGPVGPGQPVPFDFTGMDGTALYTVSVNGQVVASGQANGATVSGSFVMPNLGNQAQPVNVEGSVSDPGVPSQAGQTFPSFVTIRYAPPVAPAGSTTSPQTTPASQPSPASSTPASQAPAATVPGASHPGAGSTHPIKPQPRGGSGRVGQPRGASSQRARSGAGLSVQSSRSLTAKTTPPATATHSSPSRRPQVSQPLSSTALVPARVPPASSPAATRPHIATTRNARRPAQAPTRRQLSLPHVLPPVPLAARPARSDRSTVRSTAKGGGTSLPTVIAGVVLALLVLGAGGVAAGKVLSRRRPQGPPTPATAGSEEIAVLSEADIVLQGVDMDAELERLLTQDDPHRAPVPPEPAHPR